MAKMRYLVMFVMLALVCSEPMLRAKLSVNFASGRSLGTFKTTTTLQVVSNPLLDREFVVNGTKIPNPIHDAAWNSLRELGADHVRWQPWFPYPHKAVAELDAPVPGKNTSWNFTAMLPQFNDFMNATEGHPVIWNVGTQPCWMFWGPTTNHSHCPYPKDPDVSDFGYGARGIRLFFTDYTGKVLADYYARLMSYMVKGSMVDEHGVLHSGGPAYDLSARNGHIFEFLNEGEHYYTPHQYVHDYDVTVPAIQSALGDKAPQFMGIGGCHDGFWNWWFMPNCTEWINVFLDRSKHNVPGVRIDYASMHYYATTRNRTDVTRYTSDLFGSADKWFKKLESHVAQRDRLSPSTKLALTELGLLLVDDMSSTFGADGGLPDMFFNAAAAFFAYVMSNVGIRGIDIACFSQFAGSPLIPKWGIKDMSFPSGSMISWETGLGNAKYWVLKLFLDHIHKGDTMVESALEMITEEVKAAPAEHFCGAVGPWTFNNEITLTCNDPKARIDRIWADVGLKPTGRCGEYQPNKNCSMDVLATAWAGLNCLGRHTCTIRKENPLFEKLVCFDATYITKKVTAPFLKHLSIQARCSGGMGGHTDEAYTGDGIFSVAYVSPDKKSKKLLIVNKLQHPVEVRVTFDKEMRDAGATAYIVDAKSVVRSSAHGIRQESWAAPTPPETGVVVTLQPYAVVLAALGANPLASVLI